MAKLRLDQLVLDRKLCTSRARAQALIMAGEVLVDGQPVDKAGALVPMDADVQLKGKDNPFVSRGGLKLEGALATFGVDVVGLRCLDLGASTGGFTDCLLQRGAAFVVAVDVGYGQLAHKLRQDPRVSNLERTNARSLVPEDIGGPCDLTVVDASFIGLAKLVDAAARCTRTQGQLIALVKPQFEVGRLEASKGKGVVRDPEVRAEAIRKATEAVETAGFRILATCDCVLPGPKGNVEAFVHATKVAPPELGLDPGSRPVDTETRS